MEPYVKPVQEAPEITVSSILLGVILAVVLVASTIFIGLKVARTVSGSIPAALISILMFRNVKGIKILENNMVQTIASAGEAIAAAIIFTTPALIITGYWKTFSYVDIALLTIVGGIIGVMLSVPLRKIFIKKYKLPYPEGVATAEILIAGEDSSTGSKAKSLFAGVIISSIISFLQSGLQILSEMVTKWGQIGKCSIGGSVAISPVLVGAGYIVGVAGCMTFLMGGILNYNIFIPSYIYWNDIDLSSGVSAAISVVQKAHFRYAGVGVLLVGGIYSLFGVAKTLYFALKDSSVASYDKLSQKIRTEQDIPLYYVGIVLLLGMIATFFIIYNKIGAIDQGFAMISVVITLIVSVLILLCGSVASYIVGLVGTTSMPLSGLVIGSSTLISTSLYALLGSRVLNEQTTLVLMACVIMSTSIIAFATSIAGDNMQDLKAGELVGATPWKQQVMLIIGVVASALIGPIVLQMIFNAYGIDEVLPRPGMDPSKTLAAPQAVVLSAIVKGVFSNKLNLVMIKFGIIVGLILVAIDLFLSARNSKFRVSVVLFAAGMYLPLGYAVAFFIGGLIRYCSDKNTRQTSRAKGDESNGILFASGLISGEAIMGAALTIPFAIYQSSDVLSLNLDMSSGAKDVISLIVLIFVCRSLYIVNTKKAIP